MTVNFMNGLVYGVHCLIVFGVPLLFGWVLLRRMFREASWLALLPAAVVVGLATLMAIVNELRFFYEMEIAVWSAYQFLLALTLVIVIAQPRRAPRLRLPGCVDRPWKLWLVIAGMAAVTIYYGIPAFHGYLNDAWWYHYPAAVQIQTIEHFPLTPVFAVDDPLYYHPGPDILAACWSFLLEKPVQFAYALSIVILVPCAFLLAFALLARLARNYWAALLGASFLIAGGNLRFLLLFAGKHDALGALQAFNSQTVQGLLQLIFTPSHALGIPLVLVLVLLFRHFSARPSWRLGGILGLLLGTLTLVAEWYFLPLVAGFALVMGYGVWRKHVTQGGPWSTRLIALAFLPAVVGIFVGSFNNSYLAGSFGHFWMRYPGAAEASAARQLTAELNHPGNTKDLVQEVIAQFRQPDITEDEAKALIREHKNPKPPKMTILDNRQVAQPVWTVPNLVPLRLNFSHFGRVPSWESAASKEDSFISIFSARFLMEAAPVLLLGIPFGLWLAWQRRSPVIILLAWLAVVSALPPIFLVWGHRSTDFLRFFTASYCYAALFFGWLAGDLLTRPRAPRARLLGGVLAACALMSPLGLGVIGLLPGTLDTVKAVASTARSLSQVGPPAASVEAEALAKDEADRHEAFEKLAVTTGNFLFPLTKGRDRAIIVVPADQVPPVEYFPEWMKMATLSRLQLPVGWHWLDSLYTSYYRKAVLRLDGPAIAALGAKWVIISNVFQEHLPTEVLQALADGDRFVPVARFYSRTYSMIVFKVRP